MLSFSRFLKKKRQYQSYVRANNSSLEDSPCLFISSVFVYPISLLFHRVCFFLFHLFQVACPLMFLCVYCHFLKKTIETCQRVLTLIYKHTSGKTSMGMRPGHAAADAVSRKPVGKPTTVTLPDDIASVHPTSGSASPLPLCYPHL